MRGWLLGLAMLVTAGSVAAQDLPVAPPSPLVDPYGGKAMKKAPVVDNFALGGARGQFQVTSLDKVRAAVGGGVVQKVPGQGLFDYLCYDLPSAGERVWLAVTDEMGNEGDLVDSVTVKPLQSSDPKSRTCPALPARFAPVIVDGGVRLGMSRKDIIRVLGQPSLDTGGWLVFWSDADDNRMTVTARIDGGKVVFLYVSRTSTD